MLLHVLLFRKARRLGGLVALLAAAPLGAVGNDDAFATLAAVPPLAPLRSAATAEAQPCAAAPAARPLALEDAVDQALCNNPQTRQAWANARVQAAQEGVARAAYLPTLSASVAVSRNWSDSGQTGTATGGAFSRRSGTLDFAYLLFDFGARAANLENARQLFIAAAASRDATVQGVFLSAVQAFLQAQAAVAVVDASRQAEAASLEAFKAAEARYKVGSATPADQLQARTAHAQAVLNRITAEGALKIARGTLAKAIGQDPTAPLDFAPMATAVPTGDFAAEVGQLIAEARRRRPDLAAAEAQFQAARAGIAAARAAGMPTLSLGIGASIDKIGGAPTSNNSTLGLNLSIPIFSGYSTTYRIRSAEAQAELEAARRDQLSLQVAVDVWTAHANLTTSTQTVQSADDLLASASQSEKVAAGRYKAGVGSILDLLTAQSALASARQQRIQAGFNWLIARAALAQAIGSLDAGLLTELATNSPQKARP